MLLGLWLILAPIEMCMEAVRQYHVKRKIPSLARTYTDLAGYLMCGVNDLIIEVDRLLRGGEMLALMDPLTGFMNRRGFDHAVSEWIVEAVARWGEYITCILDVKRDTLPRDRRSEIVARLTKPRLKRLGRRLIYCASPHLFDEADRRSTTTSQRGGWGRQSRFAAVDDDRHGDLRD